MICLGIDTSGAIARVAVMADGGVPVTLATDGAKTHSETLSAALRDVLDTAGESFDSVGLIAVGLGPGTWTGLRVGVTTAKALAYALGVPIVGVPTVDAVAAGVTGYSGGLAVITDARRREVYGRCYDVDGTGGIAARGDIFVAPPDALSGLVGADCALVGGGVNLLTEQHRAGRRILPAHFADVNAGVICRLAIERLRHGGPGDPADVGPIYIRKSDAETAREKKEANGEITC
jgi:tRNA threonylcarbamoyladenosine biosynthesis protein TsaB